MGEDMALLQRGCLASPEPAQGQIAKAPQTTERGRREGCENEAVDERGGIGNNGKVADKDQGAGQGEEGELESSNNKTSGPQEEEPRRVNMADRRGVQDKRKRGNRGWVRGRRDGKGRGRWGVKMEEEEDDRLGDCMDRMRMKCAVKEEVKEEPASPHQIPWHAMSSCAKRPSLKVNKRQQHDALVKNTISHGLALVKEGRALAQDEMLDEAYEKYIKGLESLLQLDRRESQVAILQGKIAQYVTEAERLKDVIEAEADAASHDEGCRSRVRARTRTRSNKRRHHRHKRRHRMCADRALRPLLLPRRRNRNVVLNDKRGNSSEQSLGWENAGTGDADREVCLQSDDEDHLGHSRVCLIARKDIVEVDT